MNSATPQHTKVALGLSGGVDSAVCASLLKEQGYDVTAVFMECWRAPGCRAEEDKKDALRIALQLDIPFVTLDFRQAYKDSVVEYFFNEYQAGRTPNPDILCNKEIKFGLFYDWAIKHGYTHVATGHYADIVQHQNLPWLAIPTDLKKDQTYFLYLLKNSQLPHILFPLGNFTKQQVRKLAEERKLHVSQKKDSVGICFIGDINVHAFLKERLGENPGEVIDSTGTVIGNHKGLWFYTIGQRSGFSIDQTTLVHKSDGSTVTKHNIPPFYVIDKLPQTNQLVVGFGAEAFSDIFTLQNIHWIHPSNSMRAIPGIDSQMLRVRIRHTGELIPCKISSQTDTQKMSIVTLAEPTKGIASGQSAVFYLQLDGYTLCLGGGIIGSAVSRSNV